jgi:hypothetical protein
MSDIYNSIAKIPKSFVDTWLAEIFPKIDQEDIDNGFIVRYFAQQVNQRSGVIFEIDKSTFNRLQNNHVYRTISIEWRIKGALDDVLGPPHINTPRRKYTGVLTANRLSLEMGDKQLPGLKYRILEYNQFWVGQ